jgi:transposase
VLFFPLTTVEKDALIGTLLAPVEVPMAENAELRRRVGELETKLGLPPKTPDNPSTPPNHSHRI